MSACAGLAKSMHDVPVEEVLVKDYLMEEWKPELIESYLSQIGLENLRVVVTSQKFAAECTMTEPIYGTKYSVEKLEKVVASECDVKLPPPNPFFPEDLSLLPLSTQ
jgi:insulysin